jgi:hypothetical protein
MNREMNCYYDWTRIWGIKTQRGRIVTPRSRSNSGAMDGAMFRVIGQMQKNEKWTYWFLFFQYHQWNTRYISRGGGLFTSKQLVVVGAQNYFVHH